ncbi:MAG: class I SAM-dependent methyltransferase [Pseudomonadota bacterium]
MAIDVNREYYSASQPGRLDYWRKMAAPRFRVAAFLKILGDIRPANLVDLGCGNGELLREIRDRYPGIRLCGIDLSPAQTEANLAADPSVEWRTLDLGAEQQFPDGLRGRFDAVLASEVVEHLPHPEIFLKNALALARPGGTLLISTQSGRVGETERRVGHHRHFSAGEMAGLLERTGWRPVKVWNCGFPFHDWSKRFANLNPDKTMERFSEKRYTHFQNFVCAALRLAFKLNSSRRGAQLFAVARCIT